MRALLCGLLLAVSLSVQAEAPDEPTYLMNVHSAREALVAGRVTAAQTALRTAINMNGSEAAAHCVMGDLERMQGNPDAALESFARCTTLAEAVADRLHQARGLLGQQRVLLADPARRDDARRVTMLLFRFAEANPTVIRPEDVRTRLQTLDLISERDAVAAEVRQRREARAAEE